MGAGAYANTLSSRSIYPTSAGQTTGMQASASAAPVAAPALVGKDAAQGENIAVQAIKVGLLGQPLRWWVIMVVALFGLMFVAKRMGEGGDFANIKMTFYNVVIISLAATIGISFMKVLFTKFPIPGLSALVHTI